MILFWIATFSSIISIFLWARDVLMNSEGKWIKLLYPIIFMILSSIAIFQYYQLDEMRKIENEAERISKNWPDIDRITFISKGERFGIILSGQTFLEKHKDRFPDTYNEFRSLIKGRLGDYSPKHESDANYAEYDDLEDVCGATITMVRNFKATEEVEDEK
ncbi:MAG: hypothetical protein V4652_13950 [Bacteroidota bacterium]|jgi:hypothetical protein